MGGRTGLVTAWRAFAALAAILLPAPAWASSVAGPRAAEDRCGFDPRDWCAAPAGDPCGAHRDEPSCRADARCRGIPYRGESFVACVPDGKGFWTNCPAVGCVSRLGRPHEAPSAETMKALCGDPRWGGEGATVVVWRTPKGEAGILELDPAAAADRGIRIFNDLQGRRILTLPANLRPGSDLARDLDRQRAGLVAGLSAAESIRCERTGHAGTGA
jgi:hypothetical protein